MKKKYVAPFTKEHEVGVSQMVCTSLPVNDKNGGVEIDGENSLSNGNNDSWNDWDNSDDK